MSLHANGPLPVSDLIPGELESARTLVATTSVGNVRHKRNQSWHGRRRRKRGHMKQIKQQGLCTEELAARKAANKAFRACARKHIAHSRTQIQSGEAAAGTSPTTVASEAGILAGLGAGSPVPIRDLVPGEYTHAAQMISLPQAFGGLGAGSPVPIRDLSHGEYETAGRMISHSQAFGSRAVPISDLVPGEYMTGGTLVDHAQSFGGMGAYHGQYGRSDLAVPTEPGVPGATGMSRTHAAQMLNLPQASPPGAPRAAAGASHASQMLNLPQANMGRPVPVADLVPGELTHAAKMIALPQAFGGMGAGAPVPRRDFVPGEIMSSAKMISRPQAFGGLGASYAVPVSDLVPGEYMTGQTLVDHAQGFGGLGAGWPVPRADFVPGEIVSGATLVDQAQGFGGMYHGQYGVPIADLKRGEYERAKAMISHPQAFGDWVPYTPGEPEPTVTQGSWLSPSQVPAWDRESGASIVAQPQNFGGLGAGNAVPRGDFVEGEIESASRMLKHGQAFGGLGAGWPVPVRDLVPGELTHAQQMISMPQAFGAMGRHPDDGPYIPFTPGEPEPADGGQGTWLSPDQVPAWDRESARKLISQHQAFGSLGATGDNVMLPSNLNLSPICDPQTGACINYATPREIQEAIGAKVGGQSALIQSKAKLPAFYEHPNLGPWGVDPAQAYQYWWAQQAAMQRAGAEAPIPIWGSPGFVPHMQDLPPSPIAQEAAFNPYNNAYPVAGTAVERF